MKEIKLNPLLIYFVPIALITGPFIPDLLISLISIIFLIEIFSEKKFHYFKNKFVQFFKVHHNYEVNLSDYYFKNY